MNLSLRWCLMIALAALPTTGFATALVANTGDKASGHAKPKAPAPGGDPGAAAKAVPEAADLRPHFKAGSSAQYDVWLLRQLAETRTAQGQTQTKTGRLETTGRVTWSVQRVRGDGGATCQYTIDWIAIKTSQDGKELEAMDSRKAGAGDKALAAMTGRPLTVEVGPDGTVEKVTGLEALHAAGEARDDDAKAAEEASFRATAQTLALLPAAGDGLKVGQSWDHSFVTPQKAGQVTEATRFTVGGLEEIAGIAVATVTSSSTLRLDVDTSKLAKGPNAPQVDVRLTTGQGSSQVMVDLQRHEVVGRNSIESRQVDTTIRLGPAVLTQSVSETSQRQVLRVSEE